MLPRVLSRVLLAIGVLFLLFTTERTNRSRALLGALLRAPQSLRALLRAPREHFRGFPDLGPKDLLHPLLTTFGNFPFLGPLPGSLGRNRKCWPVMPAPCSSCSALTVSWLHFLVSSLYDSCTSSSSRSDHSHAMMLLPASPILCRWVDHTLLPQAISSLFTPKITTSMHAFWSDMRELSVKCFGLCGIARPLHAPFKVPLACWTGLAN